MAGTHLDDPVVQILGTKRIASAEGSERFRLLVSDGQFLHSFAMLGAQLNSIYLDGLLNDFTIIRIVKHVTSSVNKTDTNDKYDVT